MFSQDITQFEVFENCTLKILHFWFSIESKQSASAWCSRYMQIYVHLSTVELFTLIEMLLFTSVIAH